LDGAGWQRLLVRVSLLYLTAAIAAILWLDFFTPLPPAGDPLRIPLLCAYGLCLAGLQWRPQWLPILVVAVLPFSALDIFWFAWQALPPRFPAVLDLLLFVEIAAVVFGGPKAGDLLAALLLAGLGLLAWRRPWLCTDFFALKHTTNLAMMLLVLHLLLRAYWRRIRLCVVHLDQASLSLHEHTRQIQELGRIAFSDVRGMLWSLGRVLELPAPTRKELFNAVSRLQAHLSEKRLELNDLDDPPELHDSRNGLAGLRTRMQGLVLGTMAAAMVVAMLRNLYQSGLVPPSTAAGALLFCAAVLLHRRSRRWGPWAFRAALLANQWLILGFDWAHRLDQPLLFGANNGVCVFLFFISALLDSPWSAGLLLAGELAALAVFARAGTDIGGPMLGVLLGFSLVAAGALWGLPANLLGRMERRREELILARWHRQRLLRTLFHDLANPLQVLFLEYEAGVEVERIRRSFRRMHKVLNLAASLENTPMALLAVELAPLLQALDDLHQKSLQAKGLGLEITCEACRAMAEPELLLESVLGNLMANAIKFSPPGGGLRLEAGRKGEWVEIRLVDQGPGIPASTVEALHKGLRLESTPGSLGEPGSGFGLGLARDYVEQMGGKLSFRVAPDGGTTAVVQLKAS
jgi:signal transduction histidine kinase